MGVIVYRLSLTSGGGLVGVSGGSGNWKEGGLHWYTSHG